MWNLSRAILLARERIYIHEWWLSPGIHNSFVDLEILLIDVILRATNALTTQGSLQAGPTTGAEG